MYRWKIIIIFLVVGQSSLLFGQSETERKTAVSSYISKQKMLLYELAKDFLIDTAENNVLLRNDEQFQNYNGRTIRHIKIQSLDFGVSISDTTKLLKNTFINISNKIHYQTRENIIRNNLFFAEGEKLSAYAMADNEKFLRDQSYLQDARIIIEPVEGAPDFVDVVILTKDMMSLGGSFKIHSNESAAITVKEDNLFGRGDHVQMQTFYDLNRDQKMGYGFAYTKRNIAGSFINAALGHVNFDKTFSSEEREEQVSYLRIEKSLINRYMQWQYSLEASVHRTQNLYNADSVYQNHFMYKYHLLDAHAAWNMDADRKDRFNVADRTRRLLGFRFFDRNFSHRPVRYTDNFYNRYADITALLTDISIFRQNFYKTDHIYGFGRNEDVPEGGGGSLTAGHTTINDRSRLYFGVNFQRYYFSTSQQYFNFTIRSGAYLFKKELEDINMLASLDFFSRLHQLSKNWKHRNFFSISAARQIKSVFNDPLIIESSFGLPDFKNNNQGASARFTLKTESVFFSPLSILFFRFAPFVFANASILKVKQPLNNRINLYSAVGGGMRIRNESLIFKTIEVKGMYFPRKNFHNENWRIEVGTNIRFKYNHEFLRRPEFVSVN